MSHHGKWVSYFLRVESKWCRAMIIWDRMSNSWSYLLGHKQQRTEKCKSLKHNLDGFCQKYHPLLCRFVDIILEDQIWGPITDMTCFLFPFVIHGPGWILGT